MFTKERAADTIAIVPKKKRQLSKKQKRLIKWLIIVLLLILAGMIVLSFFRRKSPASSSEIYRNDIYSVEYSTIQNTISATGTVESASKSYVYAEQSYPVSAIYFSVGDTVQEGDVLCTVDTSSLETEITEKEMSLDNSKKSSEINIQNAQKKYEEYLESVNDGTNTTLVNAQEGVDSAYEAMTDAQETYDEFHNDLLLGTNESVSKATKALNQAQKEYNTQYKNAGYESDALQQVQDDLDDAFDLYQQKKLAYLTDTSDKTAYSEYKDAKEDYENAEEAFEATKNHVPSDVYSYFEALLNTRNAYDQAVESANNALDNYADNVESTKKAYDKALLNQENAKKTVQDQLESYSDSLESAKLNANTDLTEYSLNRLYAELDDTNVISPISGTVTAVYAEVGSNASGLLFVIEDLDNLVVETSVSGYDVNTVKENMNATLQSDAVGDDVYDGVVTSIAPTSKKNNSGDTDTSSDIEFASEVKVMSENTKLKIGLSVQVNYIVEEEDNALTVPYDSIYTNRKGNKCVIVLEEKSNEKYLLKEAEVQTGVSDDLYISVTGDEISDGTKILDNASSYMMMLGQEVPLTSVAAMGNTTTDATTGGIGSLFGGRENRSRANDDGMPTGGGGGVMP